jgi:hypothetical protein
MAARDASDGRSLDDSDATAEEELDADGMLSSPADIESAGRSCMAILVLAAIIFLLLCVWIGLLSTGVGR